MLPPHPMGAVNMYVGSLNTAITLNFRLDRIGQDKKYGLTPEQIDYIESVIKPLEISDCDE
jgi:hypothetical protein